MTDDEGLTLGEIFPADFFHLQAQHRRDRLLESMPDVMPFPAPAAHSAGAIIKTQNDGGLGYVPRRREGETWYAVDLTNFRRIYATDCEIGDQFICVLIREACFIVDPSSSYRPSAEEKAGHIHVGEHGAHWLACIDGTRAELGSSTSTYDVNRKTRLIAFSRWELVYSVGEQLRTLVSFKAPGRLPGH